MTLIDDIIEEIYKRVILNSILEAECLNINSNPIHELKEKLFNENKSILNFSYVDNIKEEEDCLFFLYEFLSYIIFNYELRNQLPYYLLKKMIYKSNEIINKYYPEDYIHQEENLFRYIKLY